LIFPTTQGVAYITKLIIQAVWHS